MKNLIKKVALSIANRLNDDGYVMFISTIELVLTHGLQELSKRADAVGFVQVDPDGHLMLCRNDQDERGAAVLPAG